MCLLLPERMQCDVQQRKTKWEIRLDQEMKKIVTNRTFIWLILCHFYLPSFSLFVLPFSLLTHIQQNKSSDKWCTHLGSKWCLFGGNIFLSSTMNHLYEHRDLSGYNGSSVWAFLINFCHYCACSQSHKSCFFVFHQNTWHGFLACNHLSYHPAPLCSHKLLLSLIPLLFVKYLMQNKTEIWIRNNMEKIMYHIHLGLI